MIFAQTESTNFNVVYYNVTGTSRALREIKKLDIYAVLEYNVYYANNVYRRV